MASLNRRSRSARRHRACGSRRLCLTSSTLPRQCRRAARARPVPGTFEVTHTDDEWKKILGDDAFNIMRRQGTEAPGISPLLNEHRVGTFACAGCDLPLFDSKTKFDSGTGWPSFWQACPTPSTIATDIRSAWSATSAIAAAAAGIWGTCSTTCPASR